MVMPFSGKLIGEWVMMSYFLISNLDLNLFESRLGSKHKDCSTPVRALD